MADQTCAFDLGTANGSQPAPSDNHSHGHGGHTHSSATDHGHTHEIMDHPGKYTERDLPDYTGRDWKERAFTVGIGGPVGESSVYLGVYELTLVC